MQTPDEKITKLQKEVDYYKKQLNELTGNVINQDYRAIEMMNEITQMRKGFALIAALNQFKPVPVFEEIYDHFTEEINVQMQMDLSLVLQPNTALPGYFDATHIKGNSACDTSLIAREKIFIPASFVREKKSLLVNSQITLTPFIELLIKRSGIPYFILTPVVVQHNVIAYLFTGRKIETIMLAASRLLIHDMHTLEAIAGVIAAIKNQHDQFQLLVKERTRISSDMHDEIGSGITHIALLSELIQTQQKDERGLKQDINKISTSARRLVQTMSEIIWALNPQNDTLENLLAYTREQSHQYFESLNVQFEIHFPEFVPDIKLSNAERRNLYLVTREALNNVMKHSGATVILLKLGITNTRFCFSVTDNGKGMSDKNIRTGGNGLHNMKRRMKEIGGTISWRPLQQGTKVEYCMILESGLIEN